MQGVAIYANENYVVTGQLKDGRITRLAVLGDSLEASDAIYTLIESAIRTALPQIVRILLERFDEAHRRAEMQVKIAGIVGLETADKICREFRHRIEDAHWAASEQVQQGKVWYGGITYTWYLR